MQIYLPDALLNPENRDMWTWDGWRAVPKDNASAEVKEACEEHNANVISNIDIDDDEE